MALGPASTLRRRVSDSDCDQSLFFEPVQCRVKRARSGFTIRALGDFVADADGVGGIAQAKNCEQNDLFELT